MARGHTIVILRQPSEGGSAYQGYYTKLERFEDLSPCYFLLNFNNIRVLGNRMAKSKTGSFWLTETFQLTAVDTVVQNTLDLGGLVDVGDRQGLSIEQCDFIVQAYDTANDVYSNSIAGALTGNSGMGFQLTDLNPNTRFVRADDTSLIASGSLYFDDANQIASQGPDIFPDTFGKTDESRIVVNDQLYVTGAFHNNALAANRALQVTVRVKARLVTLTAKDWMAIAITGVSSD